MAEKKWTIRERDNTQVEELRQRLGQKSDTLSALLVARGLDTYDKVRSFFSPSRAQLHDPLLLKDIEKATERVIRALKRKEKILLIGDYDVDGTASTAMLLQFLRTVYNPESVAYYIPDRYREGYGVSDESLKYAVSTGARLVITLDCGTSSGAIIKEGGGIGIDFIICDHHEASGELPDAYAILNPKQPGCPYPFKELCGCGVTFKFITALCREMDLTDDYFLPYLDLLALATGADVVPIVDENRVFASLGLKKINEDPCQGIQSLKASGATVSAYRLRDVVFGLAPKINAAGRMEHGNLAVELLTATDEQKAHDLAKKLTKLNNRRREEETSVTGDALRLLQEDCTTSSGRSSVVFKPGWHKGVLGIVASRLIEAHYKPTIVLTADEKYVTGSARSIPGFDIFKAINACGEYLEKFGGHFGAAGLSLKPENLSQFKSKFEVIVSDTLPVDLTVPVIRIDLELLPDEITPRFFKNISRLEPFGHGNPRPVFLSRHIYQGPYTRIVGNNHVKFQFNMNTGKSISGIGFNLKDKYEKIGPTTPLDIVYTITENEWNGQTTLELNILDFKASN